MSSPPPPPSWYNDPSGAPMHGSGTEAAPSKKRRGLLIAGSATSALVALGIIGSIASDRDAPSAPVSTTTSTVTVTTTTTTVTTTPSTTTTTTAPPPTETPSPSDTVIVVPPNGEESTDTVPPVIVPTPDPTVPQTTYEPIPSAPAVAPFRSCAAARAAGAAPVYRGDPGYSSAIDRDGDGVACEGG